MPNALVWTNSSIALMVLYVTGMDGFHTGLCPVLLVKWLELPEGSRGLNIQNSSSHGSQLRLDAELGLWMGETTHGFSLQLELPIQLCRKSSLVANIPKDPGRSCKPSTAYPASLLPHSIGQIWEETTQGSNIGRHGSLGAIFGDWIPH